MREAAVAFVIGLLLAGAIAWALPRLTLPPERAEATPLAEAPTVTVEAVPPAATATAATTAPAPIPSAATEVPTPSPTAAAIGDVRFVLIGGLGSSPPSVLPGGPFAGVAEGLVRRGWTRENLLIQAQRDCDGVAQGAARLRQQTTEYARTRPGARFVLVGHSVGGLVAFWTLNQEVLAGADEGRLRGIVTANAPLLGASGDLPGGYCAGGRTLDDLRSLHESREQHRVVWEDAVRRARERGIGVATFGDDFDCVYALSRCDPSLPAAPEDGSSQMVAGAERHFRIGGASRLESHTALLTREADAIAGAAHDLARRE